MRGRASFLGLLVCVLTLCAALGAYGVQAVISGNVSLTPVVIVDAGHGGVDGGATGVDGVLEKEINLSIAKKLADLLRLSGFEAIEVRMDDNDISDEGLTTIRQKKSSDLKNRLALAEKYPDALYISIHQNSFPQQRYHGAQVFYGPKNPESPILAQTIQRALAQRLQPDNRREIKKAEKNLYILYNTSSRAVMVECGFLSNREECARLGRQEYQQQLAFEIMRAVCEYSFLSAAGG